MTRCCGEAADILVTAGTSSVSLLQHRFKIGHARAERIASALEKRGVLGFTDFGDSREVLLGYDELAAMKES